MLGHSDLLYETSKKVTIEWKIRNFLERKGDDEGCIRSDEFLLFDSKFNIEIYPNYKMVEDEWVSLVLSKKPSRSDVRVEYTMGLRRGVYGPVIKFSHACMLFESEGAAYGFPRFIERSQIISYSKRILGPDGSLTVFCDARVPDISTKKSDSTTSVLKGFQTLSKDFEEFYLSGCQSDVLLDVRGKKFSANRFVLSSRSSVFRAMFETDMKERITGDIKITDCDPDSFGSFLLFLYSGRLDIVSSDNALGLYTVADKYNVEDLKVECCKCLTKELSVDLVCDVLQLATLHEEQELLMRATTYFMENVRIILRTPQWDILSHDNPNLVKNLFIEMAERLKLSQPLDYHNDCILFH